jgi:hypothetical protein
VSAFRRTLLGAAAVAAVAGVGLGGWRLLGSAAPDPAARCRVQFDELRSKEFVPREVVLAFGLCTREGTDACRCLARAEKARRDASGRRLADLYVERRRLTKAEHRRAHLLDIPH